jgi:hypothetical protein
MVVEGIKFTYLLLACEYQIKDSKEIQGSEYACECYSDFIKTLNNEYKDEIISEMCMYPIPIVQKVNGKMRVVNNQKSITHVQKVLKQYNIDYSSLIFPCNVEYTNKFSDSIFGINT